MRSGSDEPHREIAASALSSIITGGGDADVRRRAATVLAALPRGLEAVYAPIQRALQEGEFEQALALLDAVVDALPEDVTVLWWRGYALHRTGELVEAAQSYQRAADLSEAAAEVVLPSLAALHLELDDVERAVEVAIRGVEVAPTDAEAHVVLAQSYWTAGDVDECVATASRALDHDPVHPTARWLLVLGQMQRGDLTAARAALSEERRVRELLLIRPEVPFVLDALETVDTSDDATSGLVDDVRREVLGSGPAPTRS